MAFGAKLKALFLEQRGIFFNALFLVFSPPWPRSGRWGELIFHFEA